MSRRNHAACIANDAVLSGHSRSLLAQFGLIPKSKRGLAASDLVNADAWGESQRAMETAQHWDRLAPAEITLFQISAF